MGAVQHQRSHGKKRERAWQAVWHAYGRGRESWLQRGNCARAAVGQRVLLGCESQASSCTAWAPGTAGLGLAHWPQACATNCKFTRENRGPGPGKHAPGASCRRGWEGGEAGQGRACGQAAARRPTAPAGQGATLRASLGLR